jgi:pimeloyl-ACP methyl ester carboxylesterase
MRAFCPDVSGDVVRHGIAIHFERYGCGRPTILLLPTWSLLHSRHWKLQIPYLARHYTVVCFDGRGTGRSGRPSWPAAYTDVEFAADALAVMDATGAGRAVLISVSLGALWALRLCAEHPDRMLGSVFVAPATPLGRPPERHDVGRFHEAVEHPVGWQKYNAHYWKTDYPDFVEFFVGQIFSEPHSTKPMEDAIGWALETDGEVLAASDQGVVDVDASSTIALTTKVACPVLVIHGTDDAVQRHAGGQALAEQLGADLITLRGSGHFPHVRDPVQVNRLIKRFVDGIGR